jgi:proteasome assembly chaperone (PAC2) family protein
LLDRDFVLLVGIEPSLKWRTFASEIIDICRKLGIASSLSLGGLVADVPHTRGARVTAFSTDPDLTERFPDLALRRSRYEGPTGILGVLADAFAKADIPTGSLWGNVPHYISASPNPKVVHGLLARLDTLYGLSLDLSEMERAGRRFERQVNEALAHNPEVAQYVQQLESRDEAEPDEPPRRRGAEGAAELPNAEDVVRQLEEFLRQSATEPPEGDEPSSN